MMRQNAAVRPEEAVGALAGRAGILYPILLGTDPSAPS